MSAMDATRRKLWSGERILVLSPTPTHPQDFGNRKRIFQICSHLKDAGAEITFVHYPAETEWRRANPWRAERAMARAWPQYLVIPPSRELHAAAKGAYHGIDEWWDDSIGTFLRWLFSVQSFDAFIVNYAWLSKAFEYAPPSVVKILDTHDKKSGRRELLEAHGIAPEYFFTTEEQEKIALSRAHLVWAIKDEERGEFERISPTPVLALPHLDPVRVLRRPKPDPEGYLRVGFLAARNSINRVNIVNFMKIAVPIFRDTFAPIKFIIAGSVCDLLEDVKSPFVEMRGRVANVDDFYEAVDCVAIPMAFSTGLKIKTGEAISAGLPVVATAHAFEGYRPADKLHQLADHASLARSLVELSFAPRSRLDELAAASSRAHTATNTSIAESFDRTRDLVREKRPSMVLAVDSRAFIHGSIFNLVMKSVYEYLRWLGNVTVLIARGSAAHLVAGEHLVDEFGRVLVADDLDGVADLRSELSNMHVGTVDVEDYLTQEQVKVLIVDALHEAFHKPCCADTTVFARADMIALAEGKDDFSVPGEAFRRAFVVSSQYSRDAAVSQAASSASFILAPCFHRSRELAHALQPNGKLPRVVLLGSPRTRTMDLALTLANSWGMKPHVVYGVNGNGIAGGLATETVGYFNASDYLEGLARGRIVAPLFAVDLSAGQWGLQLCREILERLSIPVVTAGSVGLHRSLGLPALPSTVSTEFELSEVFRAFALDPETSRHPVFQTVKASMESDRGWAYIWSFCKHLFEARDAEFA